MTFDLSLSVAAGVPTGVAFMDAGEAIHAEGFSPDRPIAAASITKSMFAATVCLLAENGELELDSPVDQDLPGWNQFSLASWREILCHRGGLPFELRREWWLRDGPTSTRQLIDALASLGPARLRGRWHYSNAGYQILGLALESRLRVPWRDLARELLWIPAGMSATDLPSGSAPGAHLAAGGVVTTLGDLCRFGRVLAGFEEWIAGPEVLGSLTDSASIVDSETVQGLGVLIDIAHRSRVFSWGTIADVTTLLAVEPGLGTVALSAARFGEGGVLRISATRILDEFVRSLRAPLGIHCWWLDGQPVDVRESNGYVVARLNGSPTALFRCPMEAIEVSDERLRFQDWDLRAESGDSAW